MTKLRSQVRYMNGPLKESTARAADNMNSQLSEKLNKQQQTLSTAGDQTENDM